MALIKPMWATLSIVFTDEDLYLEGPCHNMPLRITIQTLGKRVLVVPIDTGYLLNVCPLQTTQALGIAIQISLLEPMKIPRVR